MSSPALRSRYPYLAAFVLLAGVPAACGDDDADDAASEAASAVSAAPASGDTDRFCAAIVETYTTMNRTFAGIDETTTEEEFAQILADLGRTVLPLYDELEATAPDDLTDAVERRLLVGRQAIETGEEDLSPEAKEAERVVDEFVVSECDVSTREVTMTEYAFSGLPDELDAGVTAFVLDNAGEEDHELGVYLVPDGASGSPAELLADDAVAQSLERVGGTELPPDEGVATFIDLEPGRYVIACLLPVDPSDEESATHASLGMVAEIVVE